MFDGIWTPDVQREVFSLLGALVLIVLGLIGNVARAFIKAKLASLKDQTLASIIGRLVDAAEQKFGAKTGQQKADWLMDQIQRMGIKLDDATQAKALAYLEAAVGARNGAKAIWEQNESQAVSEAATAAVDRRLADVVAQLKAGKTGDELLRGLAETWGLTAGGAQ
jgi:hypothetical protein